MSRESKGDQGCALFEDDGSEAKRVMTGRGTKEKERVIKKRKEESVSTHTLMAVSFSYGGHREYDDALSKHSTATAMSQHQNAHKVPWSLLQRPCTGMMMPER